MIWLSSFDRLYSMVFVGHPLPFDGRSVLPCCPLLGRSKELELSSIWWDWLFPKLYPTLSSSERRMHPKQLSWAFWLVHGIYKDGFELVWTQQFRTSTGTEICDLTGPFSWMETRCPSLNQLYNHRSFVSAGHRCKLMRTLCDQRMGVHGSSTMFNRKVRCYLVQISQVSCLRETLWEDHRRKFFPSDLLFYHSAAFHISCAIRLDKKVRNFLQCTRWYTMI